MWVDIAKGASIVLVVLNHAVAALAAHGWGLPSIGHVDAALTTFRMPVFFFASGMFFAGNLRTPWKGFLKTKVAALLYLYVVWPVVQGLFFWQVPWVKPTVGPLADIALIFVIPTSHLWFVYALPLFFVATRLLIKLPMPAQVVMVGALTIVFGSGFMVTGSWAWDAMFSYFGFFFAAVHFRGIALRVAERSSWRLMLGCGVLWAALIATAYLSDMPIVSPLRVPMSVLAVTGGIILAAKLSDTRVGSWLKWLGERTLPIYLLHMVVVAGLAYYLPHGAWIPAALVHVAPFVISALGVVIPWAVWKVARRVPGIFEAPWVAK